MSTKPLSDGQREIDCLRLTRVIALYYSYVHQINLKS
jgi:hypothetical protein